MWVILSAIILPVVIGYIYGSDQMDPNTEEGKKYYGG